MTQTTFIDVSRILIFNQYCHNAELLIDGTVDPCDDLLTHSLCVNTDIIFH